MLFTRELVDIQPCSRLYNFFQGAGVLTTPDYPCDTDTTSIALTILDYADDKTTHSIMDEMLEYRDNEGVIQVQSNSIITKNSSIDHQDRYTSIEHETE